MTLSNKQKSYLEWFSDKRIDFHLAKRLRFSSLILLGMNFFSQFSFWMLFPILLIYQINMHGFYWYLHFGFVCNILYIGRCVNSRMNMALLWFLPFYEISLMLIHLILSLSTL